MAQGVAVVRRVGLSVVAGAAVAVVLAAIASAAERGVNVVHSAKATATASRAPMEPCEPTSCDPVAVAKQRAEYPPSQPIDHSKPFMTQSGAQRAALGESVSSLPASASTTQVSPVRSRQMTAAAAAALVNGGRRMDTLLADDRPVWVVTVHGKIPVDQIPGDTRPAFVSVYTAVYDAPTGFPIMQAFGVDAFAS